jgi:putative transposase
MAGIACLSGRGDWIELDFVERERTPSDLIQLDV